MRTNMVLSPVATLAYLLNHKYRGRELDGVQRKVGMEALRPTCILLNLAVPDTNELLRYLAMEGPYGPCEDVDVSLYWSTWVSESSLAAVGKAVAQLPASQAAVERLFSRCGLVTDQRMRNRLRVDSMAEEVLVRLNAQVLSRPTSPFDVGSPLMYASDNDDED